MNRIIKTALAIAALGLVGAAGAASAGPFAHDDSMTVRVGDLNTSNHDGATMALRRIKAEATKFCGPSERDIRLNIERQRCVKEMTGKAVAELNAPVVTALYSPGQPIQLAQTEAGAR